MPVLVQCPVFVLFWDYRRTKPRSGTWLGLAGRLAVAIIW